MAERMKRLEQDILTVRCPCCNELIPVRITLAGMGVDEGYISIGGCNDVGKKAPFPDVEIALDVDVMGLKFEGGIDEIMDNMSDSEKKMYRDHYEYNKTHGVYTEREPKKLTLNPDMSTSGNLDEKIVLNKDMTTTRRE